jgi:hypothetical protein
VEKAFYITGKETFSGSSAKSLETLTEEKNNA